MVQKKTTCYVCHEAVGSRQHRSESAFLTLKDRGNLFKLAVSVISVCTETERCFQQMLAATDGRLPQGKGIPDAIPSVLNSTRKYMHAETHHLADKTIVFSEHEVFKVVVIVKESGQLLLYIVYI